MEISGGSLGQGLVIGVGMALALKQKKNPAFVYNSMSDGELDEGSTWEAAMAAAHHRLDNLVCLVDVNNQQADGPSPRCRGSSRWPTSARPSAGTRSASTATTWPRCWRRSTTPAIP
ncbi:MAG: hypothetical protein IPP50_16030 [Piscinibacter sp.]|nr:hypothetical protein [Piscinibacter sp.]